MARVPMIGPDGTFLADDVQARLDERISEAASAGVRAETAVTTAQARADDAYALADAAATPAMVDQKVSTATTGLVTEAALAVAVGGLVTDAELADALEGGVGGGTGLAGDVEELRIALEGEPGSPHYAPLSTALVEEYDENGDPLPPRIASIAEQLGGMAVERDTLLVWGAESANTRLTIEQAEEAGYTILRTPFGAVVRRAFERAGEALYRANSAEGKVPDFHPEFMSGGGPAQVVTRREQMPNGGVQYRYEIAPATKVEVTEVEGVPTLRVIPYREAVGYGGEYYTVPLTRHKGPAPTAPA